MGSGGNGRKRESSREETQAGVKFFLVMGGVKRERKSIMRVGERRGKSVIEEQNGGGKEKRTLREEGRKREEMERRKEKTEQPPTRNGQLLQTGNVGKERKRKKGEGQD